MYVRAKLSEAKLSEHGATLRMRRTVRRTHEPNRDKRTERFGYFFMYRATPSECVCVSMFESVCVCVRASMFESVCVLESVRVCVCACVCVSVCV